MHGLRGMLLSRRKGTLLKIRGCRSFFGISLSITPQVPFPYLRLRKKLEASYSAIRPKWAGNRDFCARTTPGGLPKHPSNSKPSPMSPQAAGSPVWTPNCERKCLEKEKARSTHSWPAVYMVGTTGFEPATSRSRKSSNGQIYPLPSWPSSQFSACDLRFRPHGRFPRGIVSTDTNKGFVASLWPIPRQFCGQRGSTPPGRRYP